MEIKIITEELKLNVSGFSGIAENKNYVGTISALMDKMWPIVKSQGLKHKGLNIWIYESEEKVFAGVELDDRFLTETGLELKTISLKKYAYYKHIGSYSSLGQSGTNMLEEIKRLGFKSSLPYIEIYGHWTDDETKLETELLTAIE